MFERFTDQSRRAVVLAQEEARLLRHPWIGPEHVFVALMRLTGSEATRALAGTGMTLDRTRAAVLDVVGADSGRTTDGHIPFTAESKACLALALRATLESGSDEVRTGHLLVGVLQQPGPVLERVLSDLDVDREAVTAEVERIGREAPESSSSDPTGAIGITTAPAWVGRRRPMGLVGCGFCGRPAPQSGALVSGESGASICRSCADAAVALLTSSRELAEGDDAPRLWLRDPTVARAVPGMTAAQAAEAGEQIRDVFAALQEVSDDGADAVSVLQGEGLGGFIREAAGRFPHMGPATFEVQDTEFLTPERARVAFAVILRQGPSITPVGEAVLVDGTWKATRSTLTDLLALAGVQCPPPPPEG